MIKTVIDLLILHKHYNVSERVEIAKGKYEYITSWKQSFDKIKRSWHYGKRKD
jgi:hypothetical protein